MKYILCYGDSNTYGASDDGSPRYEWPIRWPGVLQRELGSDYRIYENGLGGRTTVFDDPVEEGRCGKDDLPTALRIHAPLDLVILMLGTNDCKNRFQMPAQDIALGMEWLVQYCNRSDAGRDGKAPPVLVVAPAKIDGTWCDDQMGALFGTRSSEVSAQLAPLYKKIADRNGVHFLDASQIVRVGNDGVHLNALEHEKLGQALANTVLGLFP